MYSKIIRNPVDVNAFLRILIPPSPLISWRITLLPCVTLFFNAPLYRILFNLSTPLDETRENIRTHNIVYIHTYVYTIYIKHIIRAYVFTYLIERC